MFFLSQSAHQLTHNHEVLLGLRDIAINQAYNALLTQFVSDPNPQRTIINDLIFSRAISQDHIWVTYFDAKSNLSINPQQLLDFCQSASQLEQTHILTFDGQGITIRHYDPSLEQELTTKFWGKDLAVSWKLHNSTNQALLHNLFYVLTDAFCIDMFMKENLIQKIANNKAGYIVGSNNDCSIEIVDQDHLNLYAVHSTLPYQIHPTAFFKLISLTLEQDQGSSDNQYAVTIISGPEATIEIDSQRI